MQHLDQPVDVVAPARVRELDRLAARERGERGRQVGRGGMVAPSTSTGTTATPRRQRELDLDADEVGRIVEAAPARGDRARRASGGPTITSSTVADSTERRIASTKFSPAPISRSRKTRSSPKCASSASASASRCARAVVAPVRKEDLGHRLLRRVDPSGSSRRGRSALAPRGRPSRPARRATPPEPRASAVRSRYSTCALALRSSAAARRSISAHRTGSMRSRNDFLSGSPSALALEAGAAQL
jgi:hypothetical protein